MSFKATNIEEIDQAVKFNEAIGPDHPFFTDFSGMRGEFEDRIVYKNLNVRKNQQGQLSFNPKINSGNKTLLFLGGMRGSGKTSELAKYAKELNHKECFFCVTCNIDTELDLNALEYMDILILQLDNLTKQLDAIPNLIVNKGIIDKMEDWFGQRQNEIKNELKLKGKLEGGTSVSTKKVFWGLLDIFAKFKTSVNGSHERATVVRTNLKNNFIVFANIFNEYIHEVNIALREYEIGQEVLFIVDGLEKTMSADVRHKIIIDEQNRIEKIKAYTIFTLPIELVDQRPNLTRFCNVEVFPFVKIHERDGKKNKRGYEAFKKFIDNRIERSLFENEKVIEKAVYYSGGSPRELLKILEMAAFYVEGNKVTMNALDSAIQRLANQTAQFLDMSMINKLKEIEVNNQNGRDTLYDETIQKMLENLYIMEYNSGTYKRINPLLEVTKIYHDYVKN